MKCRVISIDIFVAALLPLIMVLIYCRFFSESCQWRDGFALAPFAIAGAFAFTLPAYCVAWLFGPEFPSILGGLIGLSIICPLAKKGVLLPASIRRNLEPSHLQVAQDKPASLSLLKAWTPYLIVALLLVLTRLPELPFKTWLQSIEFEWQAMLGTTISVRVMPLYLPGSLFIITAAIAIWLQRGSASQFTSALKNSATMLLPSLVSLCAAVPMVRLFLQSDSNSAGLPAMPIALANWVGTHLSDVWIIIAPLVGALGSFIAGSATFSNLMFASFQHSVATDAHLEPSLVLALQMLGANAGNMIAVVNVVAAASVVGLHGREGEIIRYTLLPMLYYCLCASAVAWLMFV